MTKQRIKDRQRKKAQDKEQAARMQQQEAATPELPPACIAAIYQFMQPRQIVRCEAVAVSWRQAGRLPWKPCSSDWLDPPYRMTGRVKPPPPEWLAARWATSLCRMREVQVPHKCTDEHLSGLVNLTDLRVIEFGSVCYHSSISSASVQRVVEACPNITEVALLGMPMVDASCMSAIGQLKQLRTLRMSLTEAAPFDNIGLQAMGECPSLTCLLINFSPGWEHMSSVCGVDTHTFELIASQFSNLQRLLLRSVGPSLPVSTGEWNEGFKHLACLESLVELDLKQGGVDDSGMKHIAESCPNLESLTISFCDCLSSVGLRHLGKLPYLRELDMSEWQGFQLCGPWQDSFLDGLVDRLNRCNMSDEEDDEDEEDEDEDEEENCFSSCSWSSFTLEFLDLTATWDDAVRPRETKKKPGPNILALRDAGVYVKLE